MAFDDDDCPLREPPKTAEETRERAALAAEQCSCPPPTMHALDGHSWGQAQRAIAEKIRAMPVAKITSAPRECLDHDRRDTTDCALDTIVLCEHHYELRLQNTEKAARAQGEADEQARIVTMLTERATTEFMNGREDTARAYRDIVALIKKPKSIGTKGRT